MYLLRFGCHTRFLLLFRVTFDDDHYTTDELEDEISIGEKLPERMISPLKLVPKLRQQIIRTFQ